MSTTAANGTSELTIVRDGTEAGDVTDGTLITSEQDGTAYLVHHGQRELVTNVSALFAADVQPSTVRRVVLGEAALERIPLATTPAALVGTRVLDTGDQFLGAGHYMRTWGAIDVGSGQIAMQTRTRTITMFGGYHGASRLILADADGAPVFQSQAHRFGVDGTWIGQSDRTDAWWEHVDPAAATRVTQAAVFQTWDPDSFQTVLNEWVAAAQSIAQLVTSAAGVAKVFTTVF